MEIPNITKITRSCLKQLFITNNLKLSNVSTSDSYRIKTKSLKKCFIFSATGYMQDALANEFNFVTRVAFVYSGLEQNLLSATLKLF